jgi:hypothetical protein
MSSKSGITGKKQSETKKIVKYKSNIKKNDINSLLKETKSSKE